MREPFERRDQEPTIHLNFAVADIPILLGKVLQEFDELQSSPELEDLTDWLIGHPEAAALYLIGMESINKVLRTRIDDAIIQGD